MFELHKFSIQLDYTVIIWCIFYIYIYIYIERERERETKKYASYYNVYPTGWKIYAIQTINLKFRLDILFFECNSLPHSLYEWKRMDSTLFLLRFKATKSYPLCVLMTESPLSCSRLCSEGLWESDFWGCFQWWANWQIEDSEAVGRANELLAGAVQKIKSDGNTCVMLGGDHRSLCASSSVQFNVWTYVWTYMLAVFYSLAIGSISGHAASRHELSVLWVDAHADINTPLTTPTGNIHGQPLSYLIHELHSKVTDGL